jgi:hypothetical protein
MVITLFYKRLGTGPASNYSAGFAVLSFAKEDDEAQT